MTIKAFDNKTIKPLREGKPHIVYRFGYWRVSSYLRVSANRRSVVSASVRGKFLKAHEWANKANLGLLFDGKVVPCQ